MDILIPLIGGILFLTKPRFFVRKNTSEDDKVKKANLLRKCGKGLIAASLLMVLGRIFIAMSSR